MFLSLLLAGIFNTGPPLVILGRSRTPSTELVKLFHLRMKLKRRSQISLMNYQITKAISVEFNKNEIIRLSKEMETEISRLTKAMESDIQHIHEEPDAKVHLDGLPELLLHWPHKDFNLKEVMPFLLYHHFPF